MRSRWLWPLVMMFITPACGTEGDGNPAVGVWNDGKADDGTPLALAYQTVESAVQFDALAFADGGNLVMGKSLKFLIDVRDPLSPAIYFMNANYTTGPGEDPRAARYHYYFARVVWPDFIESTAEFNLATYYDDKRYYAGTVQAYPIGGQTVYGIQFYPNDPVREQPLLTGVRVVASAFSVPGARLAFVATGAQQTTRTIESDLAALYVENLTIEQVLGSLTYLAMNPGEAWGFLRVFPSDPETLTPADIPVFQELPLDLAVVAATITRAFQDASCHVNLKSKERGTPNMVLRDAGPGHALLGSLDNRPVHLMVGPNGFALEESTQEMVLQKLAEKNDRPWTPVVYEADTRLRSFAEMCPTSPATCITYAKRYGSKAANLGLLTNKKLLGRTSNPGSPSATLGYDLVPKGFGVPIQFYWDFVGHPQNQLLRDAIDELVSREKAGVLSPAERAQLVDRVQQEFYQAQFPPGQIEAARAALASALPGVNKIKVRSSANAEDLPNFDGAGLYQSFSAKVNAADNPDSSCERVASSDGGVETKYEMSPKTLACAIKGVYASNWNKRAVEERSYARLDHATAGMGLAIHNKYDNESEVAANSVLVTRVIGSAGIYGYTLSNQQGNNLVTNPEPGSIAETVAATFADESGMPSFSVLRFAKPKSDQPALDHTVLTDEVMSKLVQLAIRVEQQYCRVRPDYYQGDCDYVFLDPEKPSSLDLEFKLLQNGALVAKQVREFAGN